jgi:parallel beta-helix repeat protein
MNRRTVLSAASALTLVASAGLLVAGPLNPPPGPISSTYKTLSEVEPRIALNATNTPGDATCVFRITQPGSYYLTGNVSGVSGRNGIVISASDVTLDLAGFELLGVAGSLSGVAAPGGSGFKCITVMNGAVRAWGAHGVDLLNNGPNYSRIIDVRAADNAQYGLRLRSDGQIIRCTSSANGNTGIAVQSNCTVRDCVSTLNGANGIESGYGCSISGCSAQGNLGIGYELGDGSTMTVCASGGNASIGFLLGGECAVSHCAAQQNDGPGFQSPSGSRITDCVSAYNAADGILCAGACFISGNNCHSNGTGAGGGAGIHATGTDNRLEGNNCSGATRGISADAAGNVMVRNTCSGNTLNWLLAPGNVFGPIVDRTAPASGAVSGNSAGSSLGTTDAGANFSY